MPDGPFEHRFLVTRIDGKHADPDTKYLVLNITEPDLREAAAISAFCTACRASGFDTLADDLWGRIKEARLRVLQSGRFTVGMRVRDLRDGTFATVVEVDLEEGIGIIFDPIVDPDDAANTIDTDRTFYCNYWDLEIVEPAP